MAECEINIAVNVDAANRAEAKELERRAIAAIQRELGDAVEIDAAGIVCFGQAIGLKLGGGQDGYLVPNVEAMARRLAELEAWLAAAPTTNQEANHG